MDNSVERNKRIESIKRKRECHHHTERYFVMDVSDTDFLLKEIDLLQIALHTHQSYDRTASELHEELSRLQVERDKAIAELKRFADRDPYATGSSAKRVLSELGVPHDPLD